MLDILYGPICIYEESVVTKTLIDVDDVRLAEAERVLGTKTKKDTVNAALAEVIALAARRRDLERLTAHGLPDLADPAASAAAWR